MRTDKLAACHAKSTPKTDLTRTPRPFFYYIEKSFQVRFTIDIAASEKNTLCDRFFTKHDNALEKTWKGVAWCNPPYSMCYEFVEAAWTNAAEGYGSTFLLLPARTDTDWFFQFAKTATYRVWIRGRLKFSKRLGGAPFPSMMLVFRKGLSGDTKDVYLNPTPYQRGFSRGKDREKNVRIPQAE